MHWQGYVAFTKKQRLGKKSDTGVKAFLGETTHVEIARGSVRSNIEYCSKPESAIEGTQRQFGEIPLEEPKHEFKALLEDIKNPLLSRTEILERNIPVYIKHGRNVDALMTGLRAKCNVEHTIYNVCFWGGTGTGKTTWALENFGVKVYRKSKGDQWWDNYDRHPVVLFDDYYGEQPLSLMLNHLDKWTHQVPVKGSTVVLCQDINIITSNSHPKNFYKREIFDNKPDLKSAWERRIPESNIFECRWYDFPGDAENDPPVRRLVIRSEAWPNSTPSWNEIPPWEVLITHLTPILARTREPTVRQREEAE